MAGFDNEVVYASNVDFSGAFPVSGQVTIDGQLLIGSTATPHIKVGVPTGSAGVTVTAGSGTLNFSTPTAVQGPGISTDGDVATFSLATGYVLADTGTMNLTSTVAKSLRGQVVNRTATAVSYLVLATDYYIGVTSTAATRTITLLAAPTTNQVFVVKDESGGAATNNITITVAGGVILIDSAATYVIDTNFGAINLIWNGSQYYVW